MLDLSKYGDKTAVITPDDGELTFADLNKQIGIAAKSLLPGSLVFIVCENALPPLEYYLGALQCGTVPALLPDRILSTRLEELISAYDPEAVLLPSARRSEIEGKCADEIGSYSLIARHDHLAGKLNSELALLITTSGSTGSPKFVRISRQALEANTSAIISALSVKNTDRAITVLPMNYTYGLSVINTHLASGASLVLTGESVLQKKFWDLCKYYDVTSFSGVPYTYEMLKRLHFERMNLPALEVLTQAGGHLPEDLQQYFAQDSINKGRRFYLMYGASEATARMSVLPCRQALTKAGSCGKAVSGGELYLEDDNGKRIEKAWIRGRLVYKGANVAMGYAESRADLGKPDEWLGTLETGDQACFDEEGFFYITGRISRFLKINGNRYSLDDSERLIKETFNDIEVACTGRDDLLMIFAERDHLPVVFQQTLPHLLHLNPRNFKVLPVEAIPHTEAGKIDYYALGKMVKTC